jgi:hypothetical protein
LFFGLRGGRYGFVCRWEEGEQENSAPIDDACVFFIEIVLAAEEEDVYKAL